MLGVLLLSLAGQVDIDFYQEAQPPAIVERSDVDTYGRAKEVAKATNKAQPVLYVFGDKDADKVAMFLSSLKSNDIDLPHIVDLDACNVDICKEVRQGITIDMSAPFLQTVHATGGYGPTWREMSNTTPDKYTVWVGRNKGPVTYSGSRSYRRRGLFGRRRGYGGSYSRGGGG